MTSGRRVAASGLALLVVATAFSGSALCAPQWNSALSAGVAGVGEGPNLWEKTQFFGGVRGDVLFLREGPRSVGLGPSLAIATAGFSDFRAAAGAMALIPLGDLWGMGIEPAAYVRSSERGAFPGLSARAWFGIQTYNYGGGYAPRGGITVGYTHDLGDSDAHAIVIAAEIDGLILALPIVLLYESLRGHAEE